MSIQMKFCPSCGGKLPEPAPKFCPNCGAPLQANSVPANPAPANLNPVPAGYVPVYYVPANSIPSQSQRDSIGFGEAVKRFWKGYFDFSGRSTRAEYWWAFLFCVLFSIIPLGFLLIIIPLWAVTCRRFRDADATINYGLFFFLCLICTVIYYAILFNGHGYYGYSDGQKIGLFASGLTGILLQIYSLVVCCCPSVGRLKKGDSVPAMVKIPDKDFSIGKFPVTRQEYFDVTDEEPSDFRMSANLPIENVSWHDAMKFCERLTARERQMGRLPNGYKYTLPTSEQWEFACRAGTTTKFCSGDSESDLAKVAWYSGNSEGKTHSVGQKEPNAFGLYDMHGNVWEWCLNARGSERVVRGGGWNDGAGRCESSYVDSDDPGRRYGSLGFRVALVPVK